MRLRLGVVHWRFGPYYVTDGYAASAKIVPSATRARRATIREVNRRYHDLGLVRSAVGTGERWRVSCIPLTRRLYRCDWKVRVLSFATWSGRSKVCLLYTSDAADE